MNILVVCDHGQCRSVCMAHLLQEKGYNAIAVSEKVYAADYMSVDTPLNKWADKVLRMDEHSLVFINRGERFSPPYLNAWIGRDEWGNIYHPELIEKCKKKIEELKL